MPVNIVNKTKGSYEYSTLTYVKKNYSQNGGIGPYKQSLIDCIQNGEY